jgi:hypothetical protein
MAIHVSLNERVSNVIDYNFEADWTWNDFELAFEEELRLGESFDGARYDVIVDVLKSERVPVGSGIVSVYNSFKRSPPNSGIAVILTRSAFIRRLFDIMMRVYPDTRNNYFIAQSQNDARDIIERQRAQESAR